jgi:hypothetical protein
MSPVYTGVFLRKVFYLKLLREGHCGGATGGAWDPWWGYGRNMGPDVRLWEGHGTLGGGEGGIWDAWWGYRRDMGPKCGATGGMEKSRTLKPNRIDDTRAPGPPYRANSLICGLF